MPPVPRVIVAFHSFLFFFWLFRDDQRLRDTNGTSCKSFGDACLRHVSNQRIVWSRRGETSAACVAYRNLIRRCARGYATMIRYEGTRPLKIAMENPMAVRVHLLRIIVAYQCGRASVASLRIKIWYAIRHRIPTIAQNVRKKDHAVYISFVHSWKIKVCNKMKHLSLYTFSRQFSLPTYIWTYVGDRSIWMCYCAYAYVRIAFEFYLMRTTVPRKVVCYRIRTSTEKYFVARYIYSYA